MVSLVYLDPGEFWRSRIELGEKIIWMGTATPFSHKNRLVFELVLWVFAATVWLYIFLKPTHCAEVSFALQGKCEISFYGGAPIVLIFFALFLKDVALVLSKALHRSYAAWTITDVRVYCYVNWFKESHFSFAHECEVPQLTPSSPIRARKGSRCLAFVRGRALYFADKYFMGALSQPQCDEIQDIMRSLAKTVGKPPLAMNER
ncbi:hypothetical protein [Cypionkella psychrotolerans]|uniref:hypothetical protein n=1 Tax=Cypionkella psychrotolerans TaxID=1678131 RepID=UPI0006B407F0|nr:hypothetical protein [Cypionkella psychrotolerans]